MPDILSADNSIQDTVLKPRGSTMDAPPDFPTALRRAITARRRVVSNMELYYYASGAVIEGNPSSSGKWPSLQHSQLERRERAEYCITG